MSADGTRSRHDIAKLAGAVRLGDRSALGRAITLVESTRPDDHTQAQELLAELAPSPDQPSAAHRIGISGVPGVGKSTFIDEFGTLLTSNGYKVAVLAVDPSSTRAGGSILGDKTRMNRLAVDPNAFIRPSPTSGTLGGVTRRTRETTVVVEAAGYNIVVIETVGVGQSETAVANMTDVFLVLMLPGAGDELQGIKKGILEVADIVAVNKADGQNMAAARNAATSYSAALRLIEPASTAWSPVVRLCSALTGEGIEAIWDDVNVHREKLTDAGLFEKRRVEQRLSWMWNTFETNLTSTARSNPSVQALATNIVAAVRSGQEPPTRAANRLLDAYRGSHHD